MVSCTGIAQKDSNISTTPLWILAPTIKACLDNKIRVISSSELQTHSKTSQGNVANLIGLQYSNTTCGHSTICEKPWVW